jgi:hypothetical protein
VCTDWEDQNNQTTSHCLQIQIFPDKQRILANAKKLKGTAIANKVRKRLYPVLKKSRQEHKRVKMVRDKLYIEGQLSVESNTKYSLYSSAFMSKISFEFGK